MLLCKQAVNRKILTIGIYYNRFGNTWVMKNNLAIYVIVALLLGAILTLVLCSCSDTISQKRLANECIRIHIRANSNTDEDQAVKLKVRDAITAYLSSILEHCKSKSEARDILSREKQTLVDITNKTLYSNNFTYKASIALKNEYFPDRQYDGYDFPEGYYDALIIYLGEGSGDNWWCVAFPPLCFVPNTKNGEKIVYKSWVKEWLDKMFG